MKTNHINSYPLGNQVEKRDDIDFEPDFKVIYERYFGLIEIYVIRNSGTSKDAEDLFQDVMIVLVEKLNKDNFQLRAKLKTYIMAIAKNLWLKKLRDTPKYEEFDFRNEKDFYEEMDVFIKKERGYREQLKFLFSKMTAHCDRLLRDIYYKLKSIVQIQKEYGYSSKHNATNQKHKCIKQLRELKSQH